VFFSFSLSLLANVTEDTSFTYGLGADSVKVKYFRFDIDEQEIHMVVTAQTCIPIAEDIIGRTAGREYIKLLHEISKALL